MYISKIKNSAATVANKLRGLSARYLSLFLLAFLFTFVQGAGLVHHHDGDLQQQFDCNICLKSGSSNELASSTEHSFNFQRLSVEFSESIALAPLYRIVPTKSRSPPNA